MTHDYKSALDCWPLNENGKFEDYGDGDDWLFAHAETIRAALQLAQEDEQVKRERDEFININISELPSFVYIPLPEGRVIGVNQKIQSIASTGDAYKCAEIIYKSYRAKKVRSENG